MSFDSPDRCNIIEIGFTFHVVTYSVKQMASSLLMIRSSSKPLNPVSSFNISDFFVHCLVASCWLLCLLFTAVFTVYCSMFTVHCLLLVYNFSRSCLSTFYAYVRRVVFYLLGQFALCFTFFLSHITIGITQFICNFLG